MLPNLTLGVDQTGIKFGSSPMLMLNLAPVEWKKGLECNISKIFAKIFRK
jgi:hypothetical protein